MTATKTCNYGTCKKEFTRPNKMSFAQWGQISRCHDCRKLAHRERRSDSMQIDTTLGRYEVNNELIDRFLTGQVK